MIAPYYEEDGITIYHGDCRDILPHLPTVDLLLTDPPYGIGFNYLSYNDTAENLREIIDSIFPLFRANRMVISCGPTQIAKWPQSDWICSATWNTTGSFGKCGYAQWMPLLVYGKDVKGFGRHNGVLKSDVFAVSGGADVGFMRSPDEKAHTCPKPLKLWTMIYKRFIATDGLTLDPFMGSGTTLVAAKSMGLPCIGIEREKAYCDIAIERLRQKSLLAVA